jgi:hypothetical protein
MSITYTSINFYNVFIKSRNFILTTYIIFHYHKFVNSVYCLFSNIYEIILLYNFDNYIFNFDELLRFL